MACLLKAEFVLVTRSKPALCFLKDGKAKEQQQICPKDYDLDAGNKSR